MDFVFGFSRNSYDVEGRELITVGIEYGRGLPKWSPGESRPTQFSLWSPTFIKSKGVNVHSKNETSKSERLDNFIFP